MPYMKMRSVSAISPMLTFTSTPRLEVESTVVFCNSSFFARSRSNGNLWPLPTRVRVLKAPGRVTKMVSAQSLVAYKPSVSTLRTSSANADESESSAGNEDSKVPRPKVSDPPLLQFKALTSAELKQYLKSKRKRRLKYFTHLAGLLAGEGYMREFTEFLKMLAAEGINKEIFTGCLDSTQVDAGLCMLLVEGKLDEFVTLMEELTKAGYEAWRFAGKASRELLVDELSKLVAYGNTEQCVEHIKSLSECGFLVKKLIDPARVIASCAKARNLPLFHSFAKLLSRNPWHYNLVIREFGYHHDLQHAFAILEIMKEEGVAPDVYTYRGLIDTCGRANEPSKAAVVFKGMLETGFKANVFIYNSMMNVHVGDIDEVQYYYQHMQESGVAADLTTFNVLLKACGASGRAELALSYYNDIQQRGDLIMDVVTYSTLINVLGRAKMWDEALQVKANMLAAGVTPNVVTWTSIIGACAAAGLVEQSFREFDKMVIAGCHPNVNCYNMLLHACVKASQYDRAFQLFQEWNQTGGIRSSTELCNLPDLSTTTYELIAITERYPSENMNQEEPGFTRANNVMHAAQSTQVLPNLVTYNTMMKACGSDTERARVLMEEMQDAGIAPDLKSWSILMDAYGSKGDLASALKAHEEMKSAGFAPDVIGFTALIKGCVQAGEPDIAFNFFKQMKDAGVRPNCVTYNALLRAQRNCGKFHEVQRALAVYEEMREAGYAPNDFLLHGLLKEWAEGISLVPLPSTANSGYTSNGDFDKGISEYTEALVQKVAVYARDDYLTKDLTIDLHGLSKGEARTTVLAVLRIMKEQHMLGKPVEEDLIIITGMGNHSEIKGVSVIREVVVGVLQKELGLPVMSVPFHNSSRNTRKESAQTSGEGEKGSVEPIVGRSVRKDGLVEVKPRKPSNSGRLKVTKEALNMWLQKKTPPIIDQS